MPQDIARGFGQARGANARPYAVIGPVWRRFEKNGAGEGIRTLDPNLGKVVLYP
jgi:hypothetical protein